MYWYAMYYMDIKVPESDILVSEFGLIRGTSDSLPTWINKLQVINYN